MRKPLFFASFLPLLVAPLVGACAADTDSSVFASDGDEINMARAESLGPIQFGQSIDIAYSNVWTYGALKIDANAGDVIDAWVRGKDGGDARAWLVDAANKTLAMNDNADEVTKDAHVSVKVAARGAYFLVLQNKNSAPAAFSVNLSSKVAGLPDGTYRIPTKREANPDRDCRFAPMVFSVTKKGDQLTVNANPNGSSIPSTVVATGSVASGTFQGQSSHTSSPYTYESYQASTAYHRLRGSLGYEEGKLILFAGYHDGYLTTGGRESMLSGMIQTTIFGQDELPPGVQRATLADSSANSCTAFDEVIVVRMPDGKQLMALPNDLGDVALDDRVLRSMYDCRLPPSVSRQGNKLFVRRGYTCSSESALPDWYISP